MWWTLFSLLFLRLSGYFVGYVIEMLPHWMSALWEVYIHFLIFSASSLSWVINSVGRILAHNALDIFKKANRRVKQLSKSKEEMFEENVFKGERTMWKEYDSKAFFYTDSNQMIPKDVWMIVLKQLELKDLMHCSLVSRTLYRYSRDDEVWNLMLKRDFSRKVKVDWPKQFPGLSVAEILVKVFTNTVELKDEENAEKPLSLPWSAFEEYATYSTVVDREAPKKKKTEAKMTFSGATLASYLVESFYLSAVQFAISILPVGGFSFEASYCIFWLTHGRFTIIPSSNLIFYCWTKWRWQYPARYLLWVFGWEVSEAVEIAVGGILITTLCFVSNFGVKQKSS
eukprot:TRINITY_DN3875_c0_g1_i2.p1 TRINITY_DN3875_c0_g1~~TRINITY_DN3875_c0_g1_i2.p1  ORF type:complete len:341 (-),score=91.00 TRINITY_DN3875_c0_g1_i2:210-1232(-)